MTNSSRWLDMHIAPHRTSHSPRTEISLILIPSSVHSVEMTNINYFLLQTQAAVMRELVEKYLHSRDSSCFQNSPGEGCDKNFITYFLSLCIMLKYMILCTK